MQKTYTEEEIRGIAKSCIGKTFGELENMNRKGEREESANKAFFGHLFETNVYGMNINSYSRPDFEEAGVELKVTPYKRNKDGSLSAKERLVLNIIDYMSEYENTFETSHFMAKNRKLQIVWYLYEKDKRREDLRITNELLYSFPNEDMDIIKKDWEYIVGKIREGKAHELSEADTMYLGACTKGANKESKRPQPFSNEPAMQRAFCFKSSYMTGLVRKYIGNYEDVEKILKGSGSSFDEVVLAVVNKYRGKTQKALMEEFGIDSKAKNLFSILVSRMFGVRGNLRNTDEFVKAKIVPKTIRVEENGKIRESMSFPYFKFLEVANTSFEDSSLKEELETTKYMFFIFRKVDSEYVFEGIKLWNMPEVIIESQVREVYERTREVIVSGEVVRSIDEKGRRVTNFPGTSYNGVCHVRPHGRNAMDVARLPVTDKFSGVEEFTKQCFWINNSFVREVIGDIIDGKE